MANLSREIQGFRADAEPEDDSPEAAPADRPRTTGKCSFAVSSATRGGVDVFGPRLVAAAHARGFHAARPARHSWPMAPRRTGACIANTSRTTRRFSISHPRHLLRLRRGHGRAERLPRVGASIVVGPRGCGKGEVDALIAALQVRANELGAIQDNDAETTPRRVLAETVRYITNQRSRMRYADYRRQGLPITSSHIEAPSNASNRRIKGTEKFWDAGAEPLLQLVADHLSETTDLDRFWRHRPRHPLLHPTLSTRRLKNKPQAAPSCKCRAKCRATVFKRRSPSY